jgi:hypothetical protein
MLGKNQTTLFDLAQQVQSLLLIQKGTMQTSPAACDFRIRSNREKMYEILTNSVWPAFATSIACGVLIVSLIAISYFRARPADAGWWSYFC